MSRVKGIYPAPVYIAVTADGTEHRLSFWSPKGKAIDMARGRRVAEAILLTDPNCNRRATVAAFKLATKFKDANFPSRGVKYVWEVTHDHGAIVAGFIEHPSLGGRVAHDDGKVIAAPRVNWRQRASEARQALASGNIALAFSLLGEDQATLAAVA